MFTLISTNQADNGLDRRTRVDPQVKAKHDTMLSFTDALYLLFSLLLPLHKNTLVCDVILLLGNALQH